MTTIQRLESAMREKATREDGDRIVRLAQRAGMCTWCALNGICQTTIRGTWAATDNDSGFLYLDVDPNNPIPCWRCPRHGSTLCSSDRIMKGSF